MWNNPTAMRMDQPQSQTTMYHKGNTEQKKPDTHTKIPSYDAIDKSIKAVKTNLRVVTQESSSLEGGQ